MVLGVGILRVILGNADGAHPEGGRLVADKSGQVYRIHRPVGPTRGYRPRSRSAPTGCPLHARTDSQGNTPHVLQGVRGKPWVNPSKVMQRLLSEGGRLSRGIALDASHAPEVVRNANPERRPRSLFGGISPSKPNGKWGEISKSLQYCRLGQPHTDSVGVRPKPGVTHCLRDLGSLLDRYEIPEPAQTAVIGGRPLYKAPRVDQWAA